MGAVICRMCGTAHTGKCVEGKGRASVRVRPGPAQGLEIDPGESLPVGRVQELEAEVELLRAENAVLLTKVSELMTRCAQLTNPKVKSKRAEYHREYQRKRREKMKGATP